MPHLLRRMTLPQAFKKRCSLPNWLNKNSKLHSVREKPDKLICPLLSKAEWITIRAPCIHPNNWCQKANQRSGFWYRLAQRGPYQENPASHSAQEKVTLSWAEPISHTTNLKLSLPSSKTVSVLQQAITILHRVFLGQMNRPYSHFLFWLMSPEPRSAI